MAKGKLIDKFSALEQDSRVRGNVEIIQIGENYRVSVQLNRDFERGENGFQAYLAKNNLDTTDTYRRRGRGKFVYGAKYSQSDGNPQVTATFTTPKIRVARKHFAHRRIPKMRMRR